MPSAINTLRARQIREGLRVFATGWSFQLQRRDYRLAKTAQRSIGAFARKYHIASIYHYSKKLDGASHVEVTFTR